MKHEVTLELLEEMAECIHLCNWNSIDEVYAYMKACVTNSDDYDPEDWKDGKQDQTVVIDADDLNTH